MKKKNENIDIKNCCLYAPLCSSKEKKLHICCSFCPKSSCDIRCTDDCKKCKVLVNPEEVIDDPEILVESKKYNKIYPHNKKSFGIDPKEKERIDKILADLEKKKKDENDKKTIEVKVKEEPKQEVKKTRGRSKKLTKEIIETMSKDQCKVELDKRKVRYLYKNTLPQLREMLLNAITEKEE